MTTANSSLIHCDPAIMGGVAVFVGSRLPVTTLLACVDAGNSWERIVASWPWVTQAHLDAGREWASTGSLDASGSVPAAPVDRGLLAHRCNSKQLRVLYLGISGVLHPSASTYELVEGRSPWADGHSMYEAATWLAQTLERWEDVRIVLTSTQPRLFGLDAVKAQLGLSLSSKVIGHTFEDLTARAFRVVGSKEGKRREVRYSTDDYWRMNKCDIVSAHLEWLRPLAWVAVDDEDILWAPAVREHVVIVNGCRGLLHPTEQDKLVTSLQVNFQR